MIWLMFRVGRFDMLAFLRGKEFLHQLLRADFLVKF